MKQLIISLIILPSLLLYAQNGSITGRVVSEKNEPITGVSIVVQGTQYGAATVTDGSFEIKNIPFGEYTLSASMIGYFKKSVPYSLNVSSGKITIILTEQLIQTEQIVVSASKYAQQVQDLPVSAAVIQPDFITRNNFQTFDDMLRFVPGVQMNLEQPSIRGSSGYSKGTGARVLVAVNGIPMYTGDTGEIIWELIPTADIERVEIIKGPASSLYGSSAIGGVINIITKNSVKNPITHFRSYIGAYDNPAYSEWKWNNDTRTFYGVELTHSNSAGKLGYTFSFKKFDNMSYRKNDFSKRYLGYIKLTYDLTPDNSIIYFADYLNMDRGNFLYWGDSRSYALIDTSSAGNTVKSNRLFTGLIYHHRFSKDVTAELKSSYYYTKFDGYGKELTESIGNLFRNEVITNINLSDVSVLTSGAEVSNSTINSNLFRSPKFFGTGIYSQLEYKGIAGLIASFGVRYDYMKMDSVKAANAVTPKIGFNYKAAKDFILRASFGTGFRAPTPSEVFTTTALGGGFSITGNPDLTAETSLSVEAGCIYEPEKEYSFDLSLYMTNYNDYIEANLTSTGNIKFVNVPKARIEGLEFGSNLFLIPDLLKVNLGYNFMWARNLTDNKFLKYRPRHSFNTQVRFTPYPFDIGVDFRCSSRIDEIDDLITQPPLQLVVDGSKRVPVYVTDVYLGYSLLVANSQAKIFFNARNIFNYNYVEFIGNLAPIRNYSISLELYF